LADGPVGFTNIKKGLHYAAKFVSREHALSLLDQGIVSATGFLSTLMIAHWADASQLGIYALGLSVLVSVVAFQDSLILQPYTIQRFHPEEVATVQAGASLMLSALFSAGSVLILIVAASVLTWRASADTIAITWTVAGVMPFALTRDFARRFDFAHLAVGRVVLLDFGTAVVQLSCLALLGLTGRMSALGACGALGIATVVPTAIWFYHSRTAFRFSRPQLRTTLKQTWALGKWLVVSRITGQIEQYITYWLAAVVGGTALTGAYAACMSIIGFANPLMIGLTNAYMPRLVLAWKQGGGRPLMHEALRNAALIAVLMIAFTITVSAAGEQVMAVLFQGKDFIGHGRTLVVLAVAVSLGTLGTPASVALAAMERPRAIIVITALEALITLPLVWILLRHFGLLGAAFGLLAGCAIGASARWIAFYRLVPKLHGRWQGPLNLRMFQPR
jgi:O-antigen/teichoic acid export membrane protein